MYNLNLRYLQKRSYIILLQGEYRIVFQKLYPCDSTNNHSILFNVYFNKKTLSITEMKGNLTYLIPFDDTLIVSILF